jgi:hypothetical protein
MRILLAASLFASACATSGPDDSFQPGGIPQPPANGGKGDSPVSCGAGTCDASLCAWDCSSSNAMCAEACTTEARQSAYVTANVGGSAQASFDSRSTAYMPKYALDNVLIYGCELWNFGDHQGLEIEYTELVHSSFTVDASDPSRYQRKLDIFVDGLHGAGSYSGAEGSFETSNTSDRYVKRDGCTVDAQSQDGGLSGSFSCQLPSGSGGSVSVSGQFACPGNSLSGQVFVAWTPS